MCHGHIGKALFVMAHQIQNGLTRVYVCVADRIARVAARTLTASFGLPLHGGLRGKSLFHTTGSVHDTTVAGRGSRAGQLELLIGRSSVPRGFIWLLLHLIRVTHCFSSSTKFASHLMRRRGYIFVKRYFPPPLSFVRFVFSFLWVGSAWVSEA